MPATPTLSVVICTHKPARERLARVLAALREQTLPCAHWELLLIDNASASPIDAGQDFTWHPRLRLIPEPELGLTRARLRGIDASAGDVIVFVDDDNLLAPDFLAQAAAVATSWPMLGAWGGRIDPEFEVTPPAWTHEYWFLLAIAQIEQPRWSNQADCSAALPVGAGLCVRRAVAERYAERVRLDPLRRSLDRVGSSLSSGGDIDLALTAIDCGLGLGRFPALRVTHLIPAGRLERDYLLKLAESVAYSAVLMHYVRGKPLAHLQRSKTEALLAAWRRFRLSGVAKAFAQAYARGEASALKTIATLERRGTDTLGRERPSSLR